MPTPCGLTRQELDAHNLVENQRCTALFEDRDGNEVTCDKLYSSHPLSTQAQAGGGGQGQDVCARLVRIEEAMGAISAAIFGTAISSHFDNLSFLTF
jgi:hypothetical protein